MLTRKEATMAMRDQTQKMKQLKIGFISQTSNTWLA